MKYRVYECKLASLEGVKTFEFLADNKELAEDHAFFSLANDDDFVKSEGRPVAGSVKFVGYSDNGTLDENDNVEYLY